MMRAGKDYMTGVPEYEDKRFLHLQELVQTIKAQPVAEGAEEPIADEDKPAANKTNQNKPTLKLK